ncbi:PREDICTED: STRUBBELIG-RECEPTOR FAMILY [Prunus dulcis]|uniref:PREDICTED: STRUBBELIG-RECEPTOR FAMILY n=1 Tax=Prunus dulcis TaxID=3755 RepID=A0A5E4F636_PRUDU|nr:protein STRUBBELIG-RECEPTOR FAMILY 3-like isoform X1 [Prunus dulcis]VVA23545.1 PREDICTED: STRUBBELIG-RECEPTOR FAMILY [Prunus dulcis]
MGCVRWEVHMQFFIGLMLILIVPFSVALTDPLDVAAINGLYVALGYPPLQGWLLVGGDPCGDHWQGVECVFSNVTGLKLNGAKLGGQLGDSLGLFGSVIEIDLSNNHIGGSIPSPLPPTVRNVSLSNNLFTGSIPGGLSSLAQLLQLSLDNNHLSGEMPDAFQLLTGLNRLDLSGNNLSGQLCPSLGNLSSLSTLNLQNNRLVGTLNVLQDLPLQDLNIENNLFSGPIPAKLLSIPNFRKDGNPFNTTIIPSPPAPAPSFLARAPSSYEQPWKKANGPSSPVTLNSATPRKFLTAKTVTGIAVGGILVLIVFILCLLVRCFKGRREKKKAKQHELNTYKIPRESTKHSESSLPEGVPMEKVPKEAVMKPLDGYGADSNRMVVIPKPQKENKIDVQSIAESSMHKKDHVVDMTDMDAEFLPPPPPPFFLAKGTTNPVGPTRVTTSRCPMKSPNPSSVKVFTVASLQQYTNSFSEENFIGAGMLGSVYRAKLPDQKVLAVKKLDNTACRQHSDEEFMDLVYNICTTRHANIVELVGYCAEHGQRLLVYEYCRNGTLHDALHTDDEIHQKLSWSVRIRIALGAARALEYLHEVCQPPIVHHNFKSANLLLDEKLEVHVSDCGLAPLIMSPSMSGHLLTAYGSAAPEFDSGSYTHQSDVYSFGVVMLELLTGRKSYDRSRPRGEQYLVRWAVPKLHDIDALSRMVDPSLNGAFTMKSLSRFADIISSCVQREPEFRPPISEIVQELLQMV